MDQLRPVAQATLAGALDGIDEAEQVQMRMMLERMRGNLSRRGLVETAHG